MLKVNNKKTINNLSKKSIKANKTRNIVAVFAIALTCILFTTIFTIGGGLLKSIHQATCRQVGTTAHAGYKYLTMEEYENIKTHPSIKDVSYNICLSVADNPELMKLRTEIRYSEDKSAKWGFNLPSTGTMPKEYKDLAASTLVLDKLGVPHEIGQKVTLEFKVKDKEYKETFNLCGFWEGDPIAMAQQIWLSKDYVVDTAPMSNVAFYDRDVEDAGIEGTVACEIWFNNSLNIDGKIEKVTVDSGYNPDEYHQSKNWAYGATSMDFSTMFLLVTVLGVIFISGYLIIYNIFLIQIAKDTRYYGLLKTIGTTGKQIKTIVKKQARLFSVFGIPVGLIIGYVIGVILLPLINKNMITKDSLAISANPFIFIGAAIFTYLTVMISCKKPAKHASKVSPIEALRYNEVTRTNKKKRNTKSFSLAFMAKQNIFRNKKKVVFVVLSLMLSVVLINSAYSIVSGFDVDSFLERRILCDYSVAHSKLVNFYQMNYVDDDTFDTLNNIDGVEEIGCSYISFVQQELTEKAFKNVKRVIDERLDNDINPKYSENDKRQAIEDNTINVSVYGVDEILYDKLDMLGGEFDYDKFITGDYIYVGPYLIKNDGYDYPFYEEGDKLELTFRDGKTKEYTVLGQAHMPHAASCMSSSILGSEFILPASEYLKHDFEKTPIHVLLNVQDDKEEKATAEIEKYCENTLMSVQSKASAIEEYNSEQTMFWTVGGTLAIILGIIGILNFINTTLTSVISRQREFAMLQSVGMTSKQLKSTLILEGMLYGLLTIISSLTLGNLIVYAIVNLWAGDIWFFTYKFKILPMILAIPVIAIISYIVPTLAYKNMSRKSIVERLRETE